MSFGFGVGDLLAVIDKAKKVRADFKNAPKQFAAISEEVNGLEVLLSQIKGDMSARRFESEESNLATIMEGPTAVLQELQNFVTGKYNVFQGAGKTFTTAMVIERLQQLPEVRSSKFSLAYAFCNYQRSDDSKEKEQLSLVRSLLRTVLENPSGNTWPDVVTHSYERHKDHAGLELGLDETFELLMAALKPKAGSFIVIDALDELTSSRFQLLQRLCKLQVTTGIKLFFTFRDIEDIARGIEKSFKSTIEKRILATDEDVGRFLSTEIAKLGDSTILSKPGLEDEVKRGITRASGEMRVPSCRASFAHYGVLRKREKEQGTERSEKAVQALMLLTFARRPLTVKELLYALTVDLESPEDGVDVDNLYSIEWVTTSCAGLVTVQTASVCQPHTPATAAPPQENENNVNRIWSQMLQYLAQIPSQVRNDRAPSIPRSSKTSLNGAFASLRRN
ncbi:hypothetical protein N0V82_009680 [Gnomoniopsis sp. IMI 355080]|nr:hypothetical protein N0V82_009680 [Gnomoniopsis sp. IMI 355080]